MKYIGLFGLVLILNLSINAQSDTITQRIVLIGDAGQLTNGRHPVVDAVKKKIPLDSKTTVLFLGDNLYKSGLPDDQYALQYLKAKAVLDSQISIADGTPAQVYMIPGNHDWDNGRAGGFDAIIRQQLYVDFLQKPNVKYYPKDGCPGPEEIDLGEDITLILFDSQWWLHPHDKPEIESDCSCKTKEELVTQIGDIAARNAKKLIIVACHHPFESNGMHGGYYTIKQHIFPLTDIRKNLYIPLPIIGSIYPILRSVFGTPQDTKHPNYANMIDQVSDAVKSSSPNVVFVSGHDHNLQLIRENNYNYIVSGGGCKQTRTSKNTNSLFNSTSEGFTVMEVSADKKVSIAFYTVGDSVTLAYNKPLLNFSITTDTAFTTSNLNNPDLNKDSITKASSKNYPLAKGFKKFIIGQNYRPEWSAPVNMKVFKISEEKNGLTVISLGGGNQTQSLRLKDKNGKEWVLRTVDKMATKAIPRNLRGTFAEDIALELNSASHPYAPLAIPGLADALDIAAPHPELFFVPDDPSLGFYRKIFANKICMLEERHATNDTLEMKMVKRFFSQLPKEIHLSKDTSETKTTTKFFDKMLEENDHRPIQQEVLKARLLDIVVGDFDRHLDQWRWGSIDTGKGKIYYPIPRDRDQAFFNSDGFLLKALSRRALPFLKGFRYDIPKVNWLGYGAKDFDRLFLTDLDDTEWEKTIAEVQQKLTDSVIRKAVWNMPPEISRISGETIARKMMSRRDILATEAMNYYRFISRKVNILGSNKKEYFKISKYGDGLQVKVFARTKKNDTSFVMYSRVFNPSTTKELRLYGLNDDDIFDIEDNVTSRIKIRIIGGKGYDTFDIKGNVETLLYDLKDGGNHIKNNSRAKNRFSTEAPVNDKDIFGFNYNTTRFPQLHFGQNTDDGFWIGGAFSKRTFGFRNLPYASDQRLAALYSVSRKAWQFNYVGEFNHITRKTDLVIKANFSSPVLRNFFGFGNNTEIDLSKPKDFYQSRYKLFETEALLRKRFFEKLHIMAGPAFYSYRNSIEDNRNNFFGKPVQNGLDSAGIYSKKDYLGGKLVLLLDNRNDELFPTRGIHWQNEFVSIAGLKKGNYNYTAFTSDMSVYASFTDPAKFVAVLKFGGGHIFSKNYEYFQALTLGANNNLPGFRKNRYAGTSTLYSGLELRVKLFGMQSNMLPGQLGLTGFYDAGRVWLPGERSKRWHGAYGGGVYFVPFNLFIISATAGFSEKERMFNFTVGKRINARY